MSNVRALSLGMGLLSLVAAAFAGFFIWLMFNVGHLTPLEGPPAKMAKSIATASCESLQRVCPMLAADLDAVNQQNRVDFRMFENLFHIALFGTLGWGILSGVCFLFIYAKSRQREP